jgi:two-component system nitrogen regulation sensor histidine kinase GlnL
MREADRLNTILNDMLSFTRPAVLKKKPLNIHRVLDSVIMLMEESGGPPELVKEYDPSIPEVSGDEGQLTQVFLNLAKNACEAVGAEGRVTVVTRMTTDFHLVPGGSEVTGGRRRMMASVEVRDNGPGIEPDDLEKIFTPFFTTKGGGSGLGMPISLKIVKEHGGLLRIYSTPGEGTSVMVYLPLAEDGGGEG